MKLPDHVVPEDLIHPALDKGFVELIDFMGDDDAPVDAARVSFNKQAQNYSTDQNNRLTRYLIEHNHGTPFEMVTFKFRVHAPVITWWQWVRHRVASYNFVSGRYVPFDEDQFMEIAADQWRLQSKSNKQGSEGFLLASEGTFWSAALKGHIARSFELYDRAVKRGIAKEQARLFLPFATCYYTAIVQMNARSLMNFLKLREDGHAIRAIVSRTHPRLFGG